MAIELYDDEKGYENEIETVSKSQRSLYKKLGLGVLSLLIVSSFGNMCGSVYYGTTNWSEWGNYNIEESLCPIYDKIAPKGYYKDNSTIELIIKDKDFRSKSAEKLSNAIKIDTSVYDDAPEVSVNPDYWVNFIEFHEYLEATFPTVYATFKVETVNSYGLVYTWEGSDDSLKPVLLTAHQDVVPVQEETIPDWDYPPFSGHYDGKLIHGRGTGDCKNLLIGLLETAELIIAEDFKPKRTLVLAFGADEEISGHIFASKIGKFLEDRYGANSFYAILDEGSGSLEKLDDIFIASPATAEKGATDIIFELYTPGGHSSVPPDHTSIGILSDLITLLEANPFEPVLSTSNPALEYMQCIAKYSDTIEPSLKKNILRAGIDKFANSKTIEYFNSNKYLKFLIRTSQAADIIQGGAKSNALPEHVAVTINHRVSFESNTQETYDRSLGFVKQIAEKYNLGVLSDDGTELVKPTTNGYFHIKFNGRTEPTRVSPTSSDVWSLYSGALRHLYEDIVFEGSLEKPVIVAPNVPTGNTDTRHYLNLTDNIYRSVPGWSPLSMLDSHVHSVNERIDFDMHLHVIAFYYEYLHLVLDEFAN